MILHLKMTASNINDSIQKLKILSKFLKLRDIVIILKLKTKFYSYK